MKIKGFLFKKARRTFSVAFFVVITFFFSFLIIPSDILAKTIKIGEVSSDFVHIIGKTGIGIDSPTATLQINPAASTEGLRIISSNYSPFVIRNSANTADLFRIDQSGNIVGGNAGSWTLNGNNLYPVSTSYNVGIGTTNPLARLQINNQGAINTVIPGPTSYYGLYFNGQTTSDYATGITWNGGTSGTQAGIYVQGSGAYGTKMYLATTNSYALGAQTRLTINHLGSVGIGTTNPTQKLTVVGNVGFDTGSFTTDGSGTATFESFLDKSNVLYKLDPSNTGTSLNVAGSGVFGGNVTMGDLIVNGGDITVNNNNGGVLFSDNSAYWLRTATNWGLYWDASANQFKFNGGGTTRASIDLDTGEAYFNGSVSANKLKIYQQTSGISGASAPSTYSSGTITHHDVYGGSESGWPTSYGNLLTIMGRDRHAAFQIFQTGSMTADLRVRSTWWDNSVNGWGSWRQVAFTDSPSFSGNIYFPGAGIWNSSGNVGIGKTNPTQKLTVVGNVGFDTGKFTTDGSGNATFESFRDVSNSLYKLDPSDTNTSLYVAGTVSALGTATNNYFAGNVGIGVSPSQKLQVAGNIYVNGSILAPEGTLRDDNGGWVRTYGSTGWYSQSYGGGWYMTDSSWIRNYGSKPLYINGNGTTAASFMSGGVGIGTTTIGSYALNVSGTANFTGNVNVLNPSQPTHAANKSYVDSVSIALGAAPGSTLRSNGDYWVSNSNLYNNGTNVGIGTTAPGVKLDVTGAIRTNNQLISTVANGTAPLAVSSNTVVANLNADYLDGQHGAYYNHRVYNDAGNYLGAGYISGGAEKPNWTGFGAGKLKLQMLSGSNTGAPDSWNDVLWMSAYTGSDVKNSNALIFGKGATDRIGFVRQAYDATAWGTYREIYHTGNSNTSGVDWNARDLTVHGGDLIINSNNGGITFNDASAYWLKTATNWGIYWDTAANQIKFNGSGTTRSFIDLDDGAAYFNGNVGIGTTAPLDKLHVVGDVRVSNLVSCSGTGQAVKTDSSGRLLCGSVSGGITGSGTTNYVARWTGASTLGKGVLYDNGTNVGIGTTAPTNKLTIVDTPLTGAPLNSSDTMDIVNNGTVSLNMIANTSGDINLLFSDTTRAMGEIKYKNSDNSLRFRTNGVADRMIINSAGNVGIGTTAPGSKLDVQTAGYGFPLTSGASQTYGGFRISPPAASGNVVLDMGVNTGSGAWLQTTLRTNLATTYPLLLNPNGGNVGIGTTNPTTKLYVNGDTTNTGYLSITGAQNTSGNIRFSAGNPYISASSYIIIPGGIYVSGGTPYFANRIEARGGIHNDTASYLTVHGGTSGNTYFNGNVGIGITNPTTKLYVNGTLSVTGATTFSKPITIGEPTLPTHAATRSYVDSVSIDLGAAPGSTLRSNGDYWVANSNLYNNGTNVGIGTASPSVKLEVNGDVKGASFTYTSDISYKKDVETIENPIAKIQALRGVRFNWKKDNTPAIGLIAQEVEKVFPEVVIGEEGNKGVSYGALVAPLIEAVKAQQEQIDLLREKIELLEKKN